MKTIGFIGIGIMRVFKECGYEVYPVLKQCTHV